MLLTLKKLFMFITKIISKETSIIFFALLVSIYAKSQTKGDNTAGWKSLKKTVNVSFASSNSRYAKEKVPVIKLQTTWQAKAWLGEKVNTQLLIWANSPIKNVRYSLSDLVKTNGKKIKSEQIQFSFLRYVWTDGYFNSGCGKRNA